MREVREGPVCETEKNLEVEEDSFQESGGKVAEGILEHLERDSEGTCGFDEISDDLEETDGCDENEKNSGHTLDDQFRESNGIEVGEDQRRYSGWEISTDPVEISEGTLACLELFSSDCWDSLGTDGRAEAMETLADHLASDLGIRFRPCVRFYETMTPYDYGEYRTQRNTIYINSANIGGGEMAAGIIAYEMRRCWQCEKANNPQCVRDQIFRDNLAHYIRPVDGMEAFRNQPVERDARAYAKGIADYV